MIRQYLQEGNVECANRMLGHNFTLSSTVEEGNHIGRTIGFPTLNLKLCDNYVLPKFGVYKTICYLDNVPHIGLLPTDLSNTNYRLTIKNGIFELEECADGQTVTIVANNGSTISVEITDGE